MNIVEWFGGIGAFTNALKKLKIEHTLVDYVDLDKQAVNAFNALNNTNYLPQDIKDVNTDSYGEIDILIAGWPCQDYSVAGKGLGTFKGTRSNLILTTIDKIAQMKNKPKYILLENVKGILQKKHVQDLEYIKKQFRDLGYKWNQVLLNAKYFDIPQNRERVYCLLVKNDLENVYISHLEEKQKINKVLKDFLDFDEPVYFINLKDIQMFNNYFIIPRKHDGALVNHSYNRVWKINKFAGAITPANISLIGYYANIKYAKEYKNKLFYRKLTPKECWRLMGFSDEDFYKVDSLTYKLKNGKTKKLVSNSALCKLAGNSIVVNVLEAIIKAVWQKKENIIHVDNMEWLQKQKDNSVDLMITSPPYNIDYWKVHSYKDNKKQLDYEREQIDFINESLRVLKPYGAFFYIHMNRYEKNQSISPYRWILKTKAKINQEIIWDKKDTGQWRNNKFAPMDEKIFWLYKEKTFLLKRGAQIFSSIWRIDRATTKDNKGHKATFPKQLIYRIINSLDVSKDIKILDAYTGTGTTNQVANHLGFENNIGLDNLEKWVKIAKIKQYEYLQFDEDIPPIQNKYTPKNNIIEKNKKAKAKVATPKQFHQMSFFDKKEV